MSADRTKRRRERTARLFKVATGLNVHGLPYSLVDAQGVSPRGQKAFDRGFHSEGVGAREIERAYVDGNKFQQARIEEFRPLTFVRTFGRILA